MAGWLRVPVVPLAIAFAAGIGVSGAIAPAWAWMTGGATLAGGVALAWAGRLASSAILLLVTLVALGALRAAPLPLAPDHVGRLSLPRAADVEGRLAREPARLTEERTRIVLDVERVDDTARSGRLQVTVHGAAPPLTTGQRVRAPVRLHPAHGFQNPGVFDYGAWLRRRGIHVVGSVSADRLVVLDAPAPPWNVQTRRWAIGTIARALPPASAALLAGLLLGDRSALPADIDARFRRAGVYHVLAVSGFNVALVAGAVFAAAAVAGLGRRSAAAAAAGAVVGFALVVGPEPSVVRAVVMALLVLGALLVDREASVLNSLALAGLVILVARPHDLVDPGFQLSFAATAGLVLAPRPRPALVAGVAASLGAQLAVIPIGLAHFNQLSTLAPLANLAVVPLAAAITVLGLLGIVLSAGAEWAGAPFLDATWPLLLALRAVVTLVASAPGALVHLPAPHWTAVVAYALGLGMALAWRRRRSHDGARPRLAAGAAVVSMSAAVGIAVWPLVRPSDGLLRVAVLDVGQGDAIVIQVPDGRAMLVDAGPGGPWRLDTGERVVAPFLWNRGVLRLAASATTHADIDHAGGMAFVHDHFHPVERWTPGAPPGERWLGSVRLSSLDPGPPPGPSSPGRTRHPRGRAINERSLVLRLDHGAASFLFTSDVGAEAEQHLLARGAPVTAAVLKVAHHGSDGSSTAPFLARVGPRVAIVSAGARNRYGHPAPPTLARLQAAGARVYRTDLDGAILLETDGAVLTVTRWAARRTDRYCLDPGGVC
jgi:competence protein ComEC